ncbi:MAG: acyl-CoA thioesterase [Maricaulaceae bacterium]|nr:acyl-CoA thioesterase [Maricaulaceae bacterium]
MTARDQFAFFHPLRVRWAECDPQGIVFNANYLLYFDVAVTEYLRKIGFSGGGMVELFIVNARTDFRAPAAADDLVDIGVRCMRIGNTSLEFAFAIFRGEELLTEGVLTYVNAIKGTKTPAPPPPAFIEAIEALEITPPQRKTAAA